MKGYKLLDKNLINQYGNKYELGKVYYLNGDLVWSKNGFHFCTNIEDTLRYAKDKDSFTITEVEASGNIICGDDYGDNSYYDFTGLYASDIFKIIRVIPRNEVIKMVVDSHNNNRVQRLIALTKLTEDEINYIKSVYNDIDTNAYINYYQYGDDQAFYKKLSK